MTEPARTIEERPLVPARGRRRRDPGHGRPVLQAARLGGALEAIAEEGNIASGPLRRRVLEHLRAELARARAEVRLRFEAGVDGMEAARLLSGAMDVVIATLFEFAATRAYPVGAPSSAERLSVAADGGYGRGELAPYSDVDLLFLMPDKLIARTEQIVEYLLYMLWDLGFTVGHSIRSVEECIRYARADLTVRTALLDARYLCGEKGLFEEFGQAFHEEVMRGTALEFYDAKLGERNERHQRLGDSRYVLEPNIKEGKGGLRDLHTLYWLWAYVDGVRDMRDLVDGGTLTAREAKAMSKAARFLWSVRFHLHHRAGRAEEVLTFDAQPEVAVAMGYTPHATTRSVERFMKHYFLIAKDVGSLTRVLCAAQGERLRSKPFWELPRLRGRWRLPDGLTVEGDWLSIEHDSVFADNPVMMVRLFREAQERGLDIHPDAFRRIASELTRVDRSLCADTEANRLFMEILASPLEPDITLRRMNEAGVLGRFIPDFGRVVAQMQYDMYHHYTVDEHTFLAIGVLRRLEKGEMKDIAPVASEQVHRIESRRALYVAVLLHDIAKGRGGDHPELGARIALKLGPRFGLTEAETETVAWLVRHHLLLSRIALKRDIDDPQTLEEFVAEVQSPERLRLLVTLTVADMQAVGEGVWNAWKAALMREVYFRADEIMSGGLSIAATDARIENALDALRRELADWTDDEFEAFRSLGSPSYWLAFDAGTLARQAHLFRCTERSESPLKVDTRVELARGVTEITVYAVDQPGLFSQIAGAMAVGGANIMDARIFTLANGLALDTFWVQDAAGGPFDRPDRIARLTTYITRAAEVRLNVHDELAKRPAPPSRTRVFTVAPRVVINNGASAGHTIIEVNARDRVGLLYDVTDAITGLGLQISSAHVTTFGERAVDVFYVKNAFGLKVENEVRLNEIREVLLAALENEAGPDSVKRKKRPAKRFGQPKPKAAPRAKSRKRTAGTGGRRKPKPAAAQ